MKYLFSLKVQSKIKKNSKSNCFFPFFTQQTRVSVQGIKSLGDHFACLCRGFEFYEVKEIVINFPKRKWKYFYTFNHFYSEKSSKRAK